MGVCFVFIVSNSPLVVPISEFTALPTDVEQAKLWQPQHRDCADPAFLSLEGKKLV